MEKRCPNDPQKHLQYRCKDLISRGVVPIEVLQNVRLKRNNKNLTLDLDAKMSCGNTSPGMLHCPFGV